MREAMWEEDRDRSGCVFKRGRVSAFVLGCLAYSLGFRPEQDPRRPIEALIK